MIVNHSDLVQVHRIRWAGRGAGGVVAAMALVAPNKNDMNVDEYYMNGGQTTKIDFRQVAPDAMVSPIKKSGCNKLRRSMDEKGYMQVNYTSLCTQTKHCC